MNNPYFPFNEKENKNVMKRRSLSEGSFDRVETGSRQRLKPDNSASDASAVSNAERTESPESLWRLSNLSQNMHINYSSPLSHTYVPKMCGSRVSIEMVIRRSSKNREREREKGEVYLA